MGDLFNTPTGPAPDPALLPADPLLHTPTGPAPDSAFLPEPSSALPARGLHGSHRRPSAAEPVQALSFGPLEIRPDELQVLLAGRRAGLTVREFQVLLVLAEREDRVVRRAEIYARVWGGEMKHRDRSVDVFVRKVRNKLSRISPDWVFIHTHFGIGYRFAPSRGIEID